MTLRLEPWEDALFVYSVEQDASSEDVESIGFASIRDVKLSDGSHYITGKFEIKPHCPTNEIDEVRKILLNHLSGKSAQ